MTQTMKSLALALLVLLSTAGAAPAADFPERLSHEELSRTRGFDRTHLPLLERLPGPGKEATAEALLTRFAAAGGSITTAGAFTQDVSESRVAVVSDAGWALKIHADGTRVSYVNFAALEANPELHVPVAQRPTESELEALGRSFIAKQLTGLVATSAEEELVPFYTEFAIYGAMAVDGSGQVEPEKVAAATVVFTRAVGGVPVVGPGSKVAVTFTNDKQPVAFDVDWAQYELRGDEQELLPLSDVLARSRVLADMAAHREPAEVEHLECGYYDPGARRKDPLAPIQAACFVQAKQRRVVDEAAQAANPADGHVLVALAEAIPAAVEVAPDGDWPEAQALAGQPVVQGGEVGETPPAQ